MYKKLYLLLICLLLVFVQNVAFAYSLRVLVKHPYPSEYCDTLGNVVSDSLARFFSIKPIIFRTEIESLYQESETNDSGYVLVTFDTWKDGAPVLSESILRIAIDFPNTDQVTRTGNQTTFTHLKYNSVSFQKGSNYNNIEIILPMTVTRDEFWVGYNNNSPFNYNVCNIGVMNDMHVGDSAPGTGLFGINGHPYTDFGTQGWNDYDNHSQSNYITENNMNIVDRINELNADFVVILGDFTQSAESSELQRAREILNDLDVPYIPILGNHDGWPYTQQAQANVPEECKIGQLFYYSMRPEYTIDSFYFCNWNLAPECHTSPDNWSYYLNSSFDFQNYKFVGVDFNSRLEAQNGHGAHGDADTNHWTLDYLTDRISSSNLENRHLFILGHHPLINCPYWFPPNADCFEASDMEAIENTGLGNCNETPYATGGHVHPGGIGIFQLNRIYGNFNNKETTFVFKKSCGPDGVYGYIRIFDNVMTTFSTDPYENSDLPVTVQFNGTFQHDPNITPINYYWDFGDGTYAEGINARDITHTYQQQELVKYYTASLTVTTATNRKVSSIKKLLKVKASPYDLDTAYVRDNGVKLIWQFDNLNLINQYIIYRDNVQIGTSNPNQKYFVDNTPPRGQSCNYEVIAVYTDGQHSPCAQLAGVQIPWLNAPSNLAINQISMTHITLTWDNNSGFTAGYQIAHQIGDNGPWSYTCLSGAGSVLYDDNYISLLYNHYYKVRAYDINWNFSPWSPTVKVIGGIAAGNINTMTALNNATKIAFDGRFIHLIYKSESGIYYTYSANFGNTWAQSTLVTDGSSIAPALALDNQHRPHIFWGAAGQYKHSYISSGNGWCSEDIGNVGTDLSAPSFTFSGNIGYMAINSNSHIYIDSVYFNSDGIIVGHPNWTCIDNITAHEIPTIVCDQKNNRIAVAYIKYQNGDNVFLKIKANNIWLPSLSLSENLDIWPNGCPNISCDHSGNICVCWLGEYDYNNGCGDVYACIVTPSNSITVNQFSSNENSYSPICISGNGNIVVWAGGNSNVPEIYFSMHNSSGWGDPNRMSTDNGIKSMYPQGCIVAGLSFLNPVLYTVWTEGNSTPYFVISKSTILPWSPTVASDMATGPNNGTHLMRVPNKKDLYMVFQNQNKIYCSHSYDEGDNWETEEIGEGLYPCVGLNSSGLPWIAYTHNGDLICKIKRPDGTYQETILFHESGLWAGQPSIALATMPIKEGVLDYAYLVYPVYEGDAPSDPIPGPPDELTSSYIYITLFDTLKAHTYLLDVKIDPNIPLSHPCVAITPADLIHITWQQGDEIWYTTNTDSVTPDNWENVQWTEKYNLSNTPDFASEHPFVTSYGDIVSVAWKENNENGIGEIIRKQRYVWEPSEYENWSEPVNLSNSSDMNSDYPQMTSGNVVLWQEQSPDGSYKVNANICDNILCLTPNANNASYVHANALVIDPKAPEIQVYYCYTDEISDNELYEVKFNTYLFPEGISGDQNEVQYYDGKVGDEVASPYCESRTGYIDYGDYQIDYGTNLDYLLKYLNPCKNYLFQAIVYQDTTGTIRQRLEVEDTLAATMRASPEIPETVNIYISPNSYKEDLASALEIIKTRGAFAALADFKIYEYEVINDSGTGGGGGQQSAGTQNLPIPTILQSPKPNPFNNHTTIRFQIPTKTKVDLKVYNSTGRLVNTLVNSEMNPGYYTMSWNGKDDISRTQGNGIYFIRLKTKDYDATKKMVLVR